ncbi:MAG: hypothetical protein JJU11_16215 [Candidatus Sumerlaeia bacterium]|nr:hypothetical protein [Candidatus Sumerlaeia bacterium]
MNPTFDDLFSERVEPLLATTDGLLPAIETLESIMPAMARPVDRADTYHWLATLHQSVAARALARNEQGEAQEHFETSEEFFIKGIEELPTRMISRLALARFYLSFGANPSSAMEILTVKDRPSVDDLPPEEIPFEHQRLAMIAVVYAMQGDLDRCGRQLEVAFAEDILMRMNEGVELASLEYLAINGVPFTPDSVNDIIRRLEKCGFKNRERLDILRQRLLRQGR